MSPKTLEYMVRHAAYVAKSDPNAKVVIAVGSVPRAKEVFGILRELANDCGFTFHVQALEGRHEGGGTLKVLPVYGELHHYGGWIMSHLWIDETLSREASQMIQTRQRSSRQHVEPPGIYDKWGVTRRHDY